MKLLAVLLAMLSFTPLLRSDVLPEFPLWANGAPGALGTNAHDIPTLTPYLPDPAIATGAAVVVCPGGGYGGLASHEGPDYALFLNKQGVTAFVLKYRLGSHGYRHPIMLNDAARAVRLVRSRWGDYKIDPRRIGIMGSSAGGHLASTLLTHFDLGHADAADPIDKVSSRPDLGILCYPVITMEAYGHAGSRENLLGKFPTADLIEQLSNEKQVSPGTPPTFLWHTVEDQAVPVRNSLEFAAALQRNGVAFDLHIYQQGRHGIGLQAKPPGFEGSHPWASDLVYWLKVQGFVKR
jgi:acetyl esterase/lipase